VRRASLFVVLWLLVGFSIGTSTLLGPVRLVVSYCRRAGWGAGAESVAVNSIIVLLAAATGLLAWILTGLVRCSPRPEVRFGVPALALLAAAGAVWLLLHPDRLRLQADLLAREPGLGAAGSLVRCFPEPLSPGLLRLETWLNSTITREQCRNARFIDAPLVHPSAMFRRDALDGGWHDNGWAEDWDLLLRMIEGGWELEKVPRVLLEWRDGPRRLTRTGAAYSTESLLRLRAHYLARGPLRGRPFHVWGAGPTGKRLARALEDHGLRPRAFYDVDRKKRIARERPVLGEGDLPAPGKELMVCAVGAAGAREEIRAVLESHGYGEGKDFLFAA